MLTRDFSPLTTAKYEINIYSTKIWKLKKEKRSTSSKTETINMQYFKRLYSESGLHVDGFNFSAHFFFHSLILLRLVLLLYICVDLQEDYVCFILSVYICIKKNSRTCDFLFQSWLLGGTFFVHFYAICYYELVNIAIFSLRQNKIISFDMAEFLEIQMRILRCFISFSIVFYIILSLFYEMLNFTCDFRN